MREIRDVVVLVEGGPEDAGAIEYGARFAGGYGAHLTVAFVSPALRADGPAAFARGRAIRDLLQAFNSESALLERKAHALFDSVMRRTGLAAEWRTIPASHAEDLVTHVRYTDIAVLARPVRETEPGSASGLAQSLVFAAGRPVILLPTAIPATIATRILIGWNASREATRAISDAMPLLARADSVELLVIDPDPRLERHGPAPGQDMARYLARHEVKVEVRVTESTGHSTASILLSRAKEFRSDLVVMGAYGHSRLTEFVFGGVTRTALWEAELPVLMSR
jgi:nucleotide-binding universal stress UspA family protein